VRFELIRPGTQIDFVGMRHRWIGLSLFLIAASLVAIPVRGIRWGIDFAGGTEIEVRFADGVAVEEGAIRRVVAACGVEDPSVVRYGDLGGSEFLIGFRPVGPARAAALAESGAGCPVTPEQQERLARAAAAAGSEGGGEGGGVLVDRIGFALGNAVGSAEVLRVEFVGPRVGSELRRDGLLALGIAFGLILAYIAFRFSRHFAPGAVVALVHDVLITAGIFVIFGLKIDLQVLAALLAIIGYSVNDTIIIYDRIRENMQLRTKYDLADVINRSVNQTLARTLLTSGLTLLSVLALLFLGGDVLRPFSLAMTIGIVVGSYSSIFIASSLLLYLEKRSGSGARA